MERHPRTLLRVCIRTLLATGWVLLLTGAWHAMTCQALGQAEVHYRHNMQMPPGAIGHEQLLRGGPLPGYFQPVQIRVPQGAQVSVAAEGYFDPPQPGPRTLGMLIGPVYRLKISNIPYQEGLEVFPTIEVINRLYPPVGRELHFPIPIELTQEEIEYALQGRFVTRVIYLEPSGEALPLPEDPRQQRYFEVAPGQDPLFVADQLGRPMAILRMGSRVPSGEQGEADFTRGVPPVMVFPLVERIEEKIEQESPGLRPLSTSHATPSQSLPRPFAAAQGGSR